MNGHHKFGKKPRIKGTKPEVGSGIIEPRFDLGEEREG